LDEMRYQTASGYFCLAAAAVGIFATIWFASEEASVIGRNIILGVIGAAAGITGMIWLGYVTHGVMAQNPPASSTPAVPPSGSGPTLNFSGSNSGIVNNGNNNTFIIHKDPREWGFDQNQADKFRASLASSKAAGTVLIRTNDTLSRQLRDQLIAIIGSVPGWKTLYQGQRDQNEIHGAVIYVRDANKLSPLGQAVIDAFRVSGFSPMPVVDSLPSWTDNDVRIEIGSPP
ncbi:MAG: hypothetical protein ABSC06_40370, partial [Rhodopila sp.]